LRSIERRGQFIYARPSQHAFPTLLLALVVWAAIFGAGCIAWAMLDLLR
jgi:hypothetical protein